MEPLGQRRDMWQGEAEQCMACKCASIPMQTGMVGGEAVYSSNPMLQVLLYAGVTWALLTLSGQEDSSTYQRNITH